MVQQAGAPLKPSTDRNDHILMAAESLMHDHRFVGLQLVLLGAFAICGAAFQWRFFMKNYKNQTLASWIGVPAVRILYIVLGAGLAGYGLLVVLGIAQ